MQSYDVTDAAVHDSQVFEALLDHSEDEGGKKRTIYADSAYRSQEKEASLATANIAFVQAIGEMGKESGSY